MTADAEHLVQREGEIMTKGNAELIAMARLRAEKYSSGSDAHLLNLLVGALEAAEAEPRYTMLEAAALIADKLEEQGIYSGAGYLRDNIRAAS